ncbi:hypothetical protein [Pseudanabaena sp. BC1403]|uniref:hypothetical protein n=1 Tax=Pseudanabaena sp. BC1403 TaxID=2043171 RepID=UPI000CD85EF7|nr:hypothetical protein [Pseudanabaena sp. BC1403]
MWKPLSPKFVIHALPIAILTLPLVSFSAIAQNTFGLTGEDGNRGRDGRNGRDGQDIKIVGDGKPAAYNLTGTIGEDAEDGIAGRSASSCEQPRRPQFSLIGASGGSGGIGGNGGNGGRGGNATIFYTDIAALQMLEIRNNGGKGGRNGRGALGGKGCDCQETSWTITTCTTEIERRSAKDANADWQHYSSHSRVCSTSGGEFISDVVGNILQNTFSSSKTPSDDGNWVYRSRKEQSSSASYSCQSGRDGLTSNNGLEGKTGTYGKITLVPRLDIPAEITSDRTALGVAIGKKVGLIKNIWVERSGLTRILRASSDVPDTYTYLKDTARLFYRFDWAAKETPAALGVDRVEIGAKVNVLNENAELEYQLPGTLEYQVIPENNLQVVKITGGFNPDRVSSFQLQKISGVGTDNQLILSDRGNVRELLKETQIEVECFSKQSATGVVAGDYVKRRKVTFKIPPKLEPNEGAKVNGNSYTLPVGRYCSPWLKADYNAAYGIVINQTTKSGAKYNQSIDSAFVVGKN